MRALVLTGVAFLLLASLAGSAVQAALHPSTIAWGHGSLIAVGGMRGSVRGLFTVDPSTGHARLLTTRAEPFAPADLAPDGRTLAFQDHGKLFTIRSDGSGPASLGPGGSPRWSPDGT